MALTKEVLEMADKKVPRPSQTDEVTSNQTLSSLMTQQTQETDLHDSDQGLTKDDKYDSDCNLAADPAEENHYDRYDQTLWDRHLEYLLTCSSFVVGIRNVLQFPAMATRNGGGAFYFVYLFLVCIVGVPILYLEMCLGQYVHGGPMKAWSMMPLAQGLGYGMLVLTSLISMFYNTYSAWSLFYFFSSFTSRLPWEPINKGNNTNNASIVVAGLVPSIQSSQKYLHENMLDLSSGLDDTGQIQPYLAACLLLSWILVGVAVYWGHISLGKIAFVTGTLPYVLLLAIFVGTITLPGAVNGIKMFLTPRWPMLGKLQVWLDGAMMVLCSMGLGTGGIINLSGFCHFHSGCFRNAMITGVFSVAGCTLAGCCMFSIFGVYTYTTEIPLNSLNISETEFAFQIFPAISHYLQHSPVWSAMFYLLLYISCFGTQIVYINTIHSGFLYKLGVHSTVWKLSSLIFFISLFYICGLTTITQAGMYVMTYLNEFVHKLAIPIFCLMECVFTTWLYGAQRFYNKVADMTGSSDSPFIKWIWKAVCPLSLVAILALTIVCDNCILCKAEVGGKAWMEPVGWFISALPVFVCFIPSSVNLITFHGSSKQRLQKLLQTPPDWGPRRHWDEDEQGTELPEYVICSPDVYHPANALALLTANLYLPNISDIITIDQQRRDSDTMVGYLSDLTLSSSDDDSSDEENKLRGNWSNRLDFVLSCLGYIVGLGNVWRFPYLVYRNGGGAFFIPYLIMLLFCGIPLVYMELAFGQYASLGPITIWKAVPLFKGIGYAMVVVSMFVAVYYNMVNAWAAYYLFTSMTSVLPWQSCNNTWNTDKCHINKYEVSNCSGVNLTYAESPEFDSNCSSVLTNCTLYNTTEIVQCIKELQDTFGNEVLDPKFLHHHRTSPSEEYFYLSVLDVSPGIHELGSIRWQLALCLLMCWTIIFICLVKGIQMSGKISYFMVTFPYIIILILLIRGMTMDGCLEGIKYYVTPKWELLRNPRVWGDAATQVFFSLSLCLGGLTTLASYNKFHNNIYRDAILVCLGDTLMSVMAGFAVFAVIGVLGKKLGTSVENVIKSDVGLTFIVYPEAILSFPISPLWSILFFLMMFMMGLSTLFTSVETIVTAIIDENITKFRKKRVLVLFVLCLSAFLLGLPLTTQGGIYILQLMDEFVAGFPPMINAVFMCIAIGWTYGVKQFCQDIMHMIGTPVSWWWRIMWYGVSPSIITFILIFSAVGYIPLRRQFDETKYPEWAEVVGFILVTVCIIPVFAWIVYRLVSIKGSIIQRLKKLCQPETDWGPALEKHWKYVEYYPAVHTQMFPSEMDNAALNTITDHVEFTTVGVRVPSLSQASLIPVSPSLPRTKKPLDMRQQAILNHAYSNPQCNLSTSSIEKLGMKRICSASESALDDIIIMPRIRPKVEMKDAATQTQTSTLCKDVSSSLSASTSSQIEDEVFEVNSPTKEKDTEVVQAIPKESSPTRKVSWNADIQLHHENRPTLIRRLSWTQKQNNTHSSTVPTRRYSLGLNHPIIYRDPLLPPKRNLLIKQDSLTQTTSLAVPTRKVSWNKDTERSPLSPSRKVSWSPEIEFYNRILSRPDIHNVSPLQKLSVSEDIELQTSPTHDSYENGNHELTNTEKCVEQQVELQSVDIYNESTVTTHVAYTSDSEDSLFADDQPAVIDVEVTHF